MISAKRTSTLPNWSKNLVSDQTWKDLTLKYNASTAFDATLGLGHAGTTTTAVVTNVGGFADMKVTATLRFSAPVSAGAEDIGIMFRYRNLDVSANYYFARLFHGTAYLYKIVNGTFTALTSGAFALPVDTDMVLTVEANGTLLTASFVADGVTTCNLNATDAAHAAGGAGIVSISSAIWCKALAVEQLR